MKKILILTVTAGNAHNACAKAMKEHLQKLDPTAEIEVVDVLKTYSTKLNIWTVDKGYSLAIGILPRTYEKFYFHYLNKPSKKRYTCAAQGVAMSIVEGLYKKICDFKPDEIFCTHFYPAVALTNLRLKYNIPAKIFVTSLDYVNSPFWEACIGIDYFNVPNEDFIKPSIDDGFTKRQILTFGIPAKERFSQRTDKKEARKTLGIDENKFTAMIIFGGGQWKGGLKIFENLAKSVSKDTQIIMINGRNKKDYDAIEKMKDKLPCSVVNVGFTDKVDLYMDAADVIVTKAGGMSITEAIYKGRPMIITQKVYGQEKCNLNYLKDNHLAVSFKNAKELKTQIERFKNDKKLYDEYISNFKKLQKNAIDDLCKFMLSQPNADYSDFTEQTKVKKAVNNARKQAAKKSKKES